jgi:hypothetical protein
MVVPAYGFGRPFGDLFVSWHKDSAFLFICKFWARFFSILAKKIFHSIEKAFTVFFSAAVGWRKSSRM